MKGVRISCEADRAVLGADKYISVGVAESHTIFAYPDMIAISKLIELPILLRKCAADEAWKDDPKASYSNQAATFFKLDLDPKSKFFGWAPLQWQDQVGSVLAMRADRKTLCPHHMEALCYFCQFKMQPLIEDSIGLGTVERTREFILGQMTKAKFEKFFDYYKAKRIAEDPSWKATLSPYATEFRVPLRSRASSTRGCTKTEITTDWAT